MINWHEVIHRKTFKVSGNEVIFFIDTTYKLFIFISFPEKDVVKELHDSRTEKEAKGLFDIYTIIEARKWYYQLKKKIY